LTIWLRYRFLLHPCKKTGVELPAPALEFLRSQILLIRSLLIVKCKEKAVEVYLYKVRLPIVHCRSREVPLLLNVALYPRLLLLIIRQVNWVLDRQWARAWHINTNLILQKWNVQEWAVKHAKE
jgi:hypothetical protein